MHQVRQSLSKQRRAQATQNLLAKCKLDPNIKAATRLGIYYPLAYELDTRVVIQAAWTSQVRLFLPVINQAKVRLMFASYAATDQLRADIFATQIPSTLPQELNKCELDCLIIPAVAVDSSGYRLGYGGGWYDRTIAACTNKKRPYLIVIGFEETVVSTVYPAEHDIKADQVILV